VGSDPGYRERGSDPGYRERGSDPCNYGSSINFEENPKEVFPH
jgi:hypothetical protein